MLLKEFTNRPESENESINRAENEKKEPSENDKILKINQNTHNYTKSKLSLALIDEILENPDLTEEQREKYNELKDEINKNNYYYIYDDINVHDYTLMQKIKENYEAFENPIIMDNIPNEIDYDIEFHKIGKTCFGMRKRYAIINKDGIFSSKDPKNKLKDLKELKNKTEYLQGAEIIKENKEEWEGQKSEGEWHNKNKNYRIRINYFIKPGDPNSKRSSFFLYLENEESLNEVFLILSNIQVTFNHEESVTTNFDRFNSCFLKSKKCYTILKILSVKEKLKKRKTFFHKIENNIKKEIKFSGKLKQDFLEKKEEIKDLIPSIVGEQSGRKTHTSIAGSKIMEIRDPLYIEPPRKESSEMLLKKMDIKKKKFINPPKDNFMPLITTISTNTTKNKRSLNDLKNKYNSLKDIIPSQIIQENKSESLDEGVCFSINQGIKVEINDGNIDGFQLNPDFCKEVKFITFDKNNQQILFKQENKESDSNQIDTLSKDNILEISNVILKNGNDENNIKDISGIEGENILEIYGPRISNNIGIEYKYINTEESRKYKDPEQYNIKSGAKKINPSDGFVIYIFQSEIEITETQILPLLSNITKSIPPDIDKNNLLDKLLFGFTIRLSNLKKIRSSYVKPKYYDNNICFIEYNNQYFIPKEYISKEVIIECYCIPIVSFSGNYDENQENKIRDLGQYLSPVKIGYTKINFEDKESINQFEYPIQDSDINLPNSLMVIDIREREGKEDNLVHIEGKDYSIGGYSYLETTINGEFFYNAQRNENIPDEIKLKYFDIKLDEDNIYLRPNENMTKDEFKDDILNNISGIEYEKIVNNEQFTFLPYCEKYVDEKTLYESPNLKCLTEEEKRDIINNTRKGDWIYKIPELKVKLLTKNIGIFEQEEKNEKKLTQYIFCNGEKKDFDLEKLTDDIYVNEKIIPISENMFNIFDENEFEKGFMKNSDNYQWKLEIQFKNELQMKTFLKLLILSRNNINKTWIDLNIDKNNYKISELLDFEQKKSGGGEVDDVEEEIQKFAHGEAECVLNIEFIDFNGNFIFEEDKDDPYLRFKLLQQPKKKDKDIFDYLSNHQLKNPNFANSLLGTDNYKKYFKDNSFDFNKKVRIVKEQFKKVPRKLVLGKVKAAFPYYHNKKNDYTLIMTYGRNKEYYSSLKISDNNKLDIICDKCECPFFEKNKENKIIGCFGLDIYEKDFEDKFLQKYEEMNKEYINDPYKIILKNIKTDEDQNDLEKYKLGLYEPNIFRRKILRNINIMGIEPTNEEQNIPKHDKNKLEDYLGKKCVKNIPNRLKDIQLNFKEEKENEDNPNVLNNHYKKKLALKLLKIKKHEEFLNAYQESEWQIYYKNHDENGDNINNLRKENFLNSKKECNELFNLIFLGIQNEEKRQIFYKIFLDIDELSQKTRRTVGNVLNDEDNELLKFFSKDLEKKSNIIFSLIDNDCSYLLTLPNCNFDKINSVKKIAKSFFVWAELRIGLKDEKDSYVYFLGILYIIYKLYDYFLNESLTFLIILGLSQKVCHFKQQNPLFFNKINYINLFGLVTKLILEKNQKNIFDKFQSLNFPIEFFISKHLSSLYADYFEGELMMRIFDILFFESGIEGKFVDDLQYLRILCAIPVTLFELNKKDILECESVSELESILNNLISHIYNNNKFKYHLQKNIEDIYYLSGYFEEYIKRDEKREWDDKRGKLYKLINDFFKPVYLENVNYLDKLRVIFNEKRIRGIELYKQYLYKIEENEASNSVKKLFNSDLRMTLQVSRLQQIYNNEKNDIKEFILEISFDKEEVTFPTKEIIINFDPQNNQIINIQELYYETNFEENHVPKHIFFVLKHKESNNILANFAYNLSNCDLMKITNIVLENKEKNNKYILEIVLFMDNITDYENNKFDLYKNIFTAPKYIYSNRIEEELTSCNISGFFFDRKLNNLINSDKDKINEFLINNNKIKLYKDLNDIKSENIHENNSFISEIKFQDAEINTILNNWISNSDISLEEIFYSMALVDKSSCINEKISLLYSIAQTKEIFLYGKKKNKLSIVKFKEMIYSLYKRFMVYFTKSDVDRMVDFLIKDERLFNIKYAFIYNKNNEKKINDFIHDIDRYEPKLFNKKSFEIYFDNINRQLNIYLNYLNNKYNITNIPKEIIIHIITTIIGNSQNISHYIKNRFNRLSLVIERDNLIYRREFEISYSASSVTSIKEINPEFMDNIIDDKENMYKMLLFHNISNLNISCDYNADNFITFDKFKKLFLKLPYLSDLLRVSVSYNMTEEDLKIKDLNQEFNSFKVVINYENDCDQLESMANNLSILSTSKKKRNYFNFYFPQNQEINLDNQNIHINMEKSIKINDSICNIIQEIMEKLKNNAEINNNVLERLKMIDKMRLYLCYYEDEINERDLKQINIGYFDNLNSIPDLKEKNNVELKIIFSTENFNVTKTINIKLKTKGYSKIFYNSDKDFIWRKAKFNSSENQNSGKIKCFDNYSPILNKEEDYVMAYNL